jgi:exopolyphosphatase/guanosine-5'-triphosphate,3'-diphosphate pyrophosphatase
LERTAAAIAGMGAEANEQGAEAIAAVGTAGLRVAGNRDDFVGTVEARCGVRIEVISGDEEARLAFLAATAGTEHVGGSLVVFETGGGSTQFTFGRDERVEEQFSVPVGAVRYTEQFRLDGVVDEPTLGAAVEAIAADLASLGGRPVPDALVAMGGAVTNLAGVKHGLETYDPDVVQGSVLEADELDRLIELFRNRGVEERQAIVGLQPARAEVILAGALVVRTVMAQLRRDSLTVSDRGLRHRLLVERFGA